ncbi:MAG: magnesium transporter [Candidatus Tectomicrobia bacterium]|uniref:Magnesium transporter MgtE n=1 Tax=Tectimicrobiota bacterium TaxID=2528274 RepID=A0A937VWP6_UNCTE|nr:magnesium transporter [Candidatus Tectomicrobia bacterium]
MSETVEQSRSTPWLRELQDQWSVLALGVRLSAFKGLPRAEAEDLFCDLSAPDQIELLLAMPAAERRGWMRLLAPDDAADAIQAAPGDARDALLALLEGSTRKEVSALLAYEEDDAGGLMSPRFARVRPDMTADEAISYLRKQTREHVETIYYVYALDAHQRLVGVVSFRQLFEAPGNTRVRDIMHTEVVAASEQMDQEDVGLLFAKHALLAIPVVDSAGCMKGVVTVDDIVDVVQEEATEDIQKIGGMEALDEPYLDVSLGRMIKKRAGWLAVLFLGETLTATAMGYFEEEIARVLVLALFIPLIISSGGNSGAQASTLVVRAMALGQVRLRDWWRIIRREFLTGLALGGILGLIGLLRILVWPSRLAVYGEHYFWIGLTVACSLVGVVLWGTMMGSMLPLLLRRLGFDPASASGPFVATLVDVTGLVIYFTVASFLLHGVLL